MKNTIFGLCLVVSLMLVGCGDTGGDGAAPPVEGTTQTEAAPSPTATDLPVFVAIWSEYPSWSAIDVAASLGLVNPKEGGTYGSLETEYGVDIVLRRRDYVQGGRDFGVNLCDAVCYTNIDALNLAKGRPCTVTRPTSTSAGADGVVSLDEFKNGVIYGPEDCVSEYLVLRAQDLGKLDASVVFTHMEPDAAGIAIQNSDDTSKVQSACLWQPFLLQAQRSQPKAALQFDSTIIPREIIDCVVWGNDSLEKEGGEQAALCLNRLIDELNKKLADSTQSDAITEAIGKKFSNLPLVDMQEVLTKCQFYGTAADAHALFSDPEWQTLMTTTVVDTAARIGVIKEEEKAKITVGFNDPSKNLNFSTKYLVIDTGGGTVTE